MTPMTPDVMAEKYLKLRNKVEEIKEAHKAQLAPFTDVMKQLEVRMLQMLQQNKAENLRTAAGTIYKSSRPAVKIDNWEEALEFIRTHEAWELLERRLAPIAVENMVLASQQPVPGATLNRTVIVCVRKPD